MENSLMTTLVTYAVVLFSTMAKVTGSKPNILVLMADDLGYGDIGAFGNNTMKTPNIDRIAAGGVKLTHHLAASSVCTPSRAAFLTGRYPIRSGMAATGDMCVFPFLASTGGLPPQEITFAELLNDAGYATALIGKWHLGLSCASYGDNCHHPMKQGFDYYYGVPLSNAKDFGNDGDSMVPMHIRHYLSSTILFTAVTAIYLLAKGFVRLRTFLIICTVFCLPFVTIKVFIDGFSTMNSLIMREFEIVEAPIDLEAFTGKLMKESVNFLEDQVAKGKPFLLFVSFLQPHTALHASKRFQGHSAHGRYGDNVEEMDWCIGKFLDTLKILGVQENTLVYFTSDHGGHVEEKGLDGQREGGYNGIFRGGKAQGGTEGGVRVPTAMMWPKMLKAGTEVSEPTSLMDILPTLGQLASVKMPQDRIIDGKDIFPLLTGKQSLSPHEYIFHYCGTDIHSIRYRPRQGEAIWKLHLATTNWLPDTEGCESGFICSCYTDITWQDPPLLYDIANDPREKNQLDISSSALYQDVVRKMKQAIQEHKGTLEDVPNQLSFSNIMWKPWLQPCCSFPSCTCSDDKFRQDTQNL